MRWVADKFVLKLFTAQGKYDEAVPLIKRSIKIFTKAYSGVDHPNVAWVLGVMGSLCRGGVLVQQCAVLLRF